MDYLQQNIDITNLSNFKTKATTKYYFEINSIEDVLKINEIRDFANTNNLKVLFIWWGTNTLFAFEEFNWIVIKNNLRWYNFDREQRVEEPNTGCGFHVRAIHGLPHLGPIAWKAEAEGDYWHPLSWRCPTA